jgi:hypothetical protein
MKAVPLTWEKSCVMIIKINLLMQFKETVYCENHMKYKSCYYQMRNV